MICPASKYQTRYKLSDLRMHPLAQLIPSRLACIEEGQCEICFGKRCVRVKSPWGLAAHGKCIKSSIVHAFYVKKVLPQFSGVSATLTGWNPNSYHHDWQNKYCWTSKCLAFRNQDCVDGYCQISLGCENLQKYEEILKQRKINHRDQWIITHRTVLESHQFWTILKDHPTLWLDIEKDSSENTTLRMVQVRLTKLGSEYNEMVKKYIHLGDDVQQKILHNWGSLSWLEEYKPQLVTTMLQYIRTKWEGEISVEEVFNLLFPNERDLQTFLLRLPIIQDILENRNNIASLDRLISDWKRN